MHRTLITLATAVALTSTAGAAELEVTLSGKAFDGMPAFEALLGDTSIGTGTLSEITEVGETFTFEVPKALAGQPLEIRFYQ